MKTMHSIRLNVQASWFFSHNRRLSKSVDSSVRFQSDLDDEELLLLNLHIESNKNRVLVVLISTLHTQHLSVGSQHTYEAPASVVYLVTTFCTWKEHKPPRWMLFVNQVISRVWFKCRLFKVAYTYQIVLVCLEFQLFFLSTVFAIFHYCIVIAHTLMQRQQVLLSPPEHMTRNTPCRLGV